MNWLTKTINPQWLLSLSILLLSVIMTLIYDFGWRFGIPIEIRNYVGLILFFCIMLGAGVGYAGARVNGAEPWRATKIGLLVPVLWYIKEIWMASEIFGLGAGVYTGLQGFYLAYYCFIFLVMGIVHLGYELYRKLIVRNERNLWRCTGYFFLPLLLVCSLEAIALIFFGFELFLFQGFLKVYRIIFM
ncbi:MAG: hypothetical protein ACJASL_005259 [Paraglaciecola sp.]|jgi:hypothetical protein